MQTFHINPAAESTPAPLARILVVDDDSTIAGLHAAVLELAGYEVVTAENGEDALMELAFGEFDLVLTDCNMPVLDGAGMVLALRSAGSRIPVVMVSGSLAHAALPPAVAREISAAIAKPAKTAEVIEAIARALKPRLPAGRLHRMPDAPDSRCAC
ncbi:MAG: response regulator [Chthoniobacteraceae bacterium]